MKKYFMIVISIILSICLLCACKSNRVTVLYASNEGGMVYGEINQRIEAGKDCTQVYAVAEDGYRFVGWSDGIKTTQRLDTKIESDKIITAQFEKIDYVTIQYASNEGGMVYGEINQRIEAGKDCTQVYAVAEEGYRFVGWSDGIKTTQRLDTKVKADKIITAQFEKIEYVTIQYSSSEGGMVYGEINQKIEAGKDCTQVYAVAEEGYRFVGWSDGIKTTQRLDTKIESDKIITAQFEKIDYVTIQYASSEGGMVYGELNQRIEAGKDCTQVYAVAEDGYRFVGWSDGIKTTQRLDTKIESDKIVTAQFEKINYVTIQYASNEGGMVYGELNQRIEARKDCTQVYAVAEDGYRFVGWSDGIKTTQRLDTKIESDKIITAQFEKIDYVTIQYASSEGGMVYGELNQRIEAGKDCTQVYAVAEDGYRFVGWSDGIKTTQRLDTKIKEDNVFTVIFEKIKVLLYSDEQLVRAYSLNELSTLNLEKVVGYKSFKVFERWEFNGFYEGYNAKNALQFIKTHFLHMSNIPDITLHAVYSDTTTGSIPFSSKTIAHALGGLDNRSYLNSKEAFELNYEKGFRFFEADVSLTQDGMIVLDHNRGEYTFEEFMSSEISGGGTPLSMENLLDYMVLYPEIWIDIDTLGFKTENEINLFASSFQKLLSKYESNIIDRMIVEVTPQNESMLMPLLKQDVGISNFLYTENWFTDDLELFEQTCLHCQENGIKFASIPSWLLNHIEEKVKLLKKYDICVLVYTTSDIDLMYRLYDSGVDCIFTDYMFI